MNAQMFLLFGMLIPSLWSFSIVFAVEPTAAFTPPSYFEIDSEFVAGCTAGGFEPTAVYAYAVKFYQISSNLSSNPTQMQLMIASWLVVNETINEPINFFGGNFESSAGVETREGDIKSFPNFEVKIDPKNEIAKGRYYCTVEVLEHELSSDTYFSKSNEWTARNSIYNPTLTVVMSNETTSSLGIPFTLTCHLNISNGYEETITLYYTYGDEDSLSKNLLAGWNYYPSSNRSTFFVYSAPLPSLARSAGEVNFPSFEAIFTPKSVEASGLYRCGCVQESSLTEYYSQGVYVQIVDDGKNHAAYDTIGLSIYLLISLHFVILFSRIF